MRSNTKVYEMDMTTGPLFKMILAYSLPVIATGTLQVAYNSADMIIAGRFAGSVALAAVGSTGSLVNLIVSLFIGLSLGANVLVARSFGAKNNEDSFETVHTAMLFGIIAGGFLAVVGLLFSKTFLTWMDSPADVIDQAARYLKIYFIGLPALMIYNYGAGILRAVGDTKRPLYYLIVSGLLNVILNIITVKYLSMGVAGVAWATVASQVLSAVLVVNCLIHTPSSVRFQPKKMKIYPAKLLEMTKIGLPAGLQSALFSVSNVLIQSSVNSFGSAVMAGCSASVSVEGFVYIAINSFSQSTVTFTSQNIGAKKYERIAPVCLYCNILAAAAGIISGALVLLFRRELLALYNSDLQVIEYGCQRMIMIVPLYFICGNMEVLTGSLRGMGKSFTAMITTLLGSCALRLVWMATVFKQFRTLRSIFIVYPISWIVTTAALFVLYVIFKKKIMESAEKIA